LGEDHNLNALLHDAEQQLCTDVQQPGVSNVFRVDMLLAGSASVVPGVSPAVVPP
jgi:hypothetical protein